MKVFGKIGFTLLAAAVCANLLTMTACNTTQQTQNTEFESAFENVKIVRIPAGKMIKTPEFQIGDSAFFTVMKKLWTQVADRHQDIFPRDFMPENDETGKHFWLYSIMGIDTGKFNTEGFEIIDFEGGLYAVATTIDPDESSADLEKAIQELKGWISQSECFEFDFRPGRSFMTQMPAADDNELRRAMGYAQIDIYIPIKIKN